MDLSACIKTLVFCLTAACFIGGIQPAQADIPDVPRVKVNIFYSRDFGFSKALENAQYKVGYGYNLLSLLSQDPAVPNIRLRSDDPNLTIFQRYPKDSKRETYLEQLRDIITVRDVPEFPFNFNVWENKQNFLALAARKHRELGLNETYLQEFGSGKINADKELACTVAKLQGKRDVVLEQQKLSFRKMTLRSARTPVALLSRNKQVYIAFLDFDISQVEVAEEEHSGRFDNAKNLSCDWKQLYIFRLEDLLTK